MSNFYEMECGCKFKILDENIKGIDGLPSIEIDYENIPLDCNKTWEVFYTGKTKGVFQLETQLGMSWAKKAEPTSIDELAVLISILRPGSLKAIVDGKSMSQHYVDRKHGEEEIKDIHPAIWSILEPTQGVMVYQEQSMKVAEKLAAFDLKQADNLRKAIGKKLADLMAKVKIEFMEGCEKAGVVTREQASEIFDIIEKSNRYSFNKSHAVGYGMMGYWTAYAKAHFPLHFFCAYLSSARNKADFKEEVEELLNDAKQFGIDVKNPSLLLGNKNFQIVDKKIYCGIGNIKGIGDSAAFKIMSQVGIIQEKSGKKLADMNWLEVLLFLGSEITKTSFVNLIATGALSHLGIYRKRMMFEYNKLSGLTGKHEIPWLQENISKFKTLGEGIELLAETDSVSKTRKEKVRSIAQVLNDKNFTTIDDEEWISSIETELIGGSLSCSKLDSCDTSCGDTTCRQFNDGYFTKPVSVACEISRVSPYVPKSGKRMLYLTIKDKTGTVECVVFSDNVEAYESLLMKGNTVCITGKKTDKGSLSVYKVIQI